ncbi:MAG TPA: Type 1 glutamine amidotransferase-like domain-containing protein [Acidimicrobiales bacterium]|nr:Type 1 glutamine amidotransferase-like domain-containing protein [Acidimicrobiales bacterium]
MSQHPGAAPGRHPGPLALVGGREWGEGCTFDAGLLAASGADEVVVLPTAAAYEHPQRAVDRATAWFAQLGARVRPLMVLSRTDAEDDEHARAVREARFVYLADGSPMHVRSVLKQSKVWHALDQAWEDGAVVAGSGAGAMILGDPMIDPRGGAFTIGLGLIELVAVLPGASTWSPERLRRTISLTPASVALVAIDEATAVVRAPEGRWTASGVGSVEVHVGGGLADLSALS